MRDVIVRAAVVLLTAFAAGCGPPPAGDARRLTEVQAKYATRYEISIYDQLYVLARARPGVRVDSAEAEQLYRDFFFPRLPTSESNAVYLNLYDERGEFLYQLASDWKTQRLERHHVEAY